MELHVYFTSVKNIWIGGFVARNPAENTTANLEPTRAGTAHFAAASFCMVKTACADI